MTIHNVPSLYHLIDIVLFHFSSREERIYPQHDTDRKGHPRDGWEVKGVRQPLNRVRGSNFGKAKNDIHKVIERNDGTPGIGDPVSSGMVLVGKQ